MRSSADSSADGPVEIWYNSTYFVMITVILTIFHSRFNKKFEPSKCKHRNIFEPRASRPSIAPIPTNGNFQKIDCDVCHMHWEVRALDSPLCSSSRQRHNVESYRTHYWRFGRKNCYWSIRSKIVEKVPVDGRYWHRRSYVKKRQLLPHSIIEGSSYGMDMVDPFRTIKGEHDSGSYWGIVRRGNDLRESFVKLCWDKTWHRQTKLLPWIVSNIIYKTILYFWKSIESNPRKVLSKRKGGIHLWIWERSFFHGIW